MLELWVDDIPTNDAVANIETCRDFMRLIRDHNIQICSSSSQTEWSKHITKWQEFFEKNGLSIFGDNSVLENAHVQGKIGI